MATDATLEANKALVRRIWEEIFNRRNLALADELIAPGSVNHEAPPGITGEGPEEVRQVVTMLTTAFPDHRIDILELVAEGDKVVTRSIFSGTHQGLFMGIPPTGKHFTMEQINITQVVNGKAVEHWGVRDDLGMMQQLGVIPQPAR
jgi:predicted ester cyclase